MAAILLTGGILVSMASAATPTFKQAAAKEISSGTTDSVAFSSANATGNAIVVSLVWNNTGAVSITDSRGNAYLPATVRTTWNSNWSAQVFYAKNVAAGTNTVTATFATSINSFGILQAHEYSGIDKANPLDGAVASAGTGTAMTTGNITTTAANDLLFDAGGNQGAMNAAPSGWTNRINTSGNRTADKTAATVGSYNATNAGSNGPWVLQLVALRADTGTDTTPPAASASLTASAASSTQVGLNWTAATDNVGVTGYQIERCAGSGCTNFAQIATTASNVLSYNDTGLSASTLYRYRVRAVDAAANLGAYSPIAQATTQAVADTIAPSVPATVSGTAASVSQINLTWAASTDNVGVTGYKVYRGGVQIGTSATASYTDTGLTANTSYSYSVSAYDSAGNNSAQSNPAVAVSTLADTAAPSVPANLSLQVLSSTQITVSWSASTDNVGVTGYHLYRCTGAACTNFALINTTTVTPVQDPGLTAGTTYAYTVSAFDAAGNESARATPLQASTPAPDNTPPAISMTAPTSGTTVSGTVTVSATASDAGSGVHDVQFFVEGNPMSDDTTVPYSFQWGTTTTANGVYHLTAVAKDNAGNVSNTSGAFTVTVNNPTSPQLPVDLVGGWNFNEGTGTTTADVTAYGNTAAFGTLGSPVWSTGKYGGGLKFNGTAQDYLTVSDSPTMNITGSALTLSMWINPSTGAPGDQVLLGKFWNGTSGQPHYQYGLELSKSLVPILYVGVNSTTQAGVAMGGSLAANQWNHLAVVYDGAHVTYYVNGALVSSSSMTGAIASRTGSTVRIGADIDSSQKFLGSLDDVRLYKRALTQSAVQADQTTPLTPSGNGTGPTIAITAPTNNQQVSNIFALTADADDATGVQFYVDGTAVGPEDTTAPYTANWDTRTAANGAHTVTARAHDANGNVTVASPITVNVSNSDSFINDTLATGFNLPTAMKFLPDGRMLVAELGGKVKIVPVPYTTPSSTLFLDITGSVAHAGVQEGIFDFALDPNFSTNHYFYVYYSANDNRDRLSRFTANATLDGTIAGSELVLYHDPTDLASDEHHGGGIAFSNDGKIFFSTGEHFQGTPAQDLTSPYGKIHRINMDGSVPTDNPFYDGAGPNWDSVYALGFRNPYRIYYDAPTGNLYVGDVGGNDYNTAYEEVDLVKPGANYGWPNCEYGTCGNPAYTPALYAYSHLGRDASVTGGFVYHGNGLSGAFPAGFEGNYFYGDYAQNWIRRLTFDGSGNVSGMNYFEPQNDVLDGPYGDVVYLTEGPDGSLYYIDLGYSDTSGTYGTSKIRRIRYQQSNQSPTAVAGSSVTAGPTPLTVNFNSTGSSDPESQPLTYSWDFGDGTPLSNQANPSHVYTLAGKYTARLTVSDGVTSTFAPPITISVGSAPTATVLSPVDGATFRAADVISFSGDATDPDDGSLPASAYSWTIDFLHEGHVHPGQVITGVKSGTFTIPSTGHDFSGNTRFRITLTVTDSTGLTDTKTVPIWPQKVNLTFNSAPQGTTLYLDGIAYTAPFVHDTLIGFQHTIEARNVTTGNNTYTFTSWSDGGTQTHVITVPAADASYTATYTVTTASNGPVAAWSFNEGSGTTAADTTGHGNAATLVNGATFAAGKTGTGLGLDGTNDYLNVPNSTGLDISGSNLTIDMWLNPTAITGDRVVYGKFWSTTMTSPYYQYGLELQAGKPVFQIGTASGVLSANMGTALTASQWSHLAVVFNGVQVQFYLNGTLKTTVPLTATITARGNAFRLGADSNTQQFYKGTMDDVRVYNRALTAAEITTDMNTGL
ncbi:MAG TPA: LamG-like jellyroll fold domain-containing protein [Candidatus Saccharimonadales bacterium]|nr:LamG-like jellyroll fold domain-containing protein [Candidatus Saccharimonadales bacterium]